MNKKQKKVAVGVGVGLTALAAAAAAGTYFFGGKRGAKNRAKVSKWANSAKADVLKQIKGMKKVTAQTYTSAVDEVMKQYRRTKKMNPKELAGLANELKGHWDSIAKEVSVASKKIVPIVKKAARQTKAKAKKVVAQVSKKARPRKVVKKRL